MLSPLPTQSLVKWLTEPWLQPCVGAKANGSQIASQAGNADILQGDVRWAGERVRHGAGDLLWRNHFVARPPSLDLTPDVRVCRGWVNVDHSDFALPQFFAHAS